MKIGFPVSRFFILVHVAGEAVGEFLDLFKESQRRFKRHPADTEIRGHHPLPADHLEKPQNVFALAEAIQEDRHRAQVHGVRAQPDQVRVDAGQFVHQNPHPLRFRRDLQPQQLLHCQAVGQVVGHGAEVVDAVGQRNHLLVELRFAGFFDAGVQVADFGLHADDRLAINFEHQSQHAMRRRVLRPHVQDMV